MRGRRRGAQAQYGGVVRWLLAQPGASKEVIVARSELYTTKRQAADIRAEAIRIILASG